MSKSILLLLVIFISLLLTQCGCSNQENSNTNFIKTEKDQFVLNGGNFRFSGTNQYYLFYKSKKMVDDVIEDAAAMGLTTIRTWGFCDGENKGGYSFQPFPRQYDESGFKQLDYTIYKASQHNIKLVIPFVNNWDDMGGMNQYVRWAGLNGHDLFYTNEWIKNLYKDYIRYVLNRVNSITGIAYKNDPTIFIWELANEPRVQSDRSGKVFNTWVKEMATFVKSIDQNHLLSTGMEGFSSDNPNGGWMENGNEGTDYVSSTSIPEIDVATMHLYPDSWGLDENASLNWIYSRIDKAKRIGKPVYLGEFGIRDKNKRDAIYNSWYSESISRGINGILFWLLSGRQDDGSLYPDYDGFTVYYPEDTNTVKVIMDNTKRMLSN